MPTSSRMPALFIGHGNPMNALERNRYTEGWSAIGERLPRPRGIVVVSAHWYRPGLAVTATPNPPTLHDFGGFPKELEDAAEVDGCGPFRIFWNIFLPNSKAVIATALIFAVTNIWGDYLTPILYLNEDKTLLAVKIATSYLDPKGVALPTVSLAANVVFMIPLVILFFVGQNYIIKGVVTSGLKG